MKLMGMFRYVDLLGLLCASALACKGPRTSSPNSAPGTQGQAQSGTGSLPPPPLEAPQSPLTPPSPAALPAPSSGGVVAQEALELLQSPLELLLKPTQAVPHTHSEVETHAEFCANRFVEKATLSIQGSSATITTPDNFNACMKEKSLTSQGKGPFEFRHDFKVSFVCDRSLGDLHGSVLTNGTFANGLCSQGAGNFSYFVSLHTQEKDPLGAVVRSYKRTKILTGSSSNSPCSFEFSGNFRRYKGCQWSDSWETEKGPQAILIVEPESTLKALPAVTGLFVDSGRAPFTFNGRPGALVYTNNGHITWSLAGPESSSPTQTGSLTQAAPRPTLAPVNSLSALPSMGNAAALPAGCAVPPEPPLPPESMTVGDGTPTNCTRETLQTALDKGGVITFKCGTEPHTIVVDKTLVVSKDTALLGANSITLNGQNSERIFMTQPQTRLILRNMALVGGRSSSSPTAPSSGGAIFSGWKSQLDIRNVLFQHNSAGSQGEEGGGAIFAKSEGKVVLVNCTFSQNSGGTGGAIHSLLSQLSVINSSFLSNNSSVGGAGGSGYGGAIYTDGASGRTDDSTGGEIQICGSSFLNNTGSGQGGAGFLFVYPPDTIVVEASHFEGNSVEKNSKGDAVGGALRLGNGEAFVRRVSFVGNVAQTQGGALWVDGTKPVTVENSTFAQNRAVDSQTPRSGLGGAIAGGYLTLSHVTFWKNQAGAMGGAIWGSDKIVIKNSALIENTADNTQGIQRQCSAPLADGGGNLMFPGPVSKDPNDVPCTPQSILENPRL